MVLLGLVGVRAANAARFARNVLIPIAAVVSLLAASCSDAGIEQVPEGAHDFGARQSFVPDDAVVVYLAHVDAPDAASYESTLGAGFSDLGAPWYGLDGGVVLGQVESDDQYCVVVLRGDSDEIGTSTTCAELVPDEERAHVTIRMEDLLVVGFLPGAAKFALSDDDAQVQQVHDGMVAMRVTDQQSISILDGDGVPLIKVREV